MARKSKGTHQEKLDWDDMTHGEASHHIGKKMTEKTHKSMKDYSRKGKSKRDWKRFGDEEEEYDY